MADRVFLGACPATGWRFISRGDYTVLCSGYEGLSHTLLESLRAGTPSSPATKAATRSGAARPERLLVPYADVGALVDTIRAAFTGEVRAAGGRHRRRLERFRWATLVEQTERVLERMHVLMISLDNSLLGDPHGNTVQRHIEYAWRIGALSTSSATRPRGPGRHAAVGSPIVYPRTCHAAVVPVAACARRRSTASAPPTSSPRRPVLHRVGWPDPKWRFGLPPTQNHGSFFDNWD